ncbi:hypothetical protein DI135_02630 [Legionella pneumophila]|nr:hypothetical protein BJK09_05830 [Legionella pneumophila]AUB71356.1 hypothetical protein BJK08_05825 [Legionella pneumophila]KXB26017.1 hypothetical protein PtVF66_05915 [Legionella pneumophila]KZX34614.1 hypothetical protein PtVFX2014_06355 [Legionella pneumophila]TIH03898.1 hypothetical protein DI135_02630 [Legionella pneumophila]
MVWSDLASECSVELLGLSTYTITTKKVSVTCCYMLIKFQTFCQLISFFIPFLVPVLIILFLLLIQVLIIFLLKATFFLSID